MAVMLACVAFAACASGRTRGSTAQVAVDDLPGVRATMSLAVDATASASVEEIRAGAHFDPYPGAIDTAGGPVPFWLRLDVDVPAELSGRPAALEMLPGHLWDLTLHTPDGGVQRAGLGVSPGDRSHFGSTPRFEVRLEAPSTRLFVRVRTTAPRLLYARLTSDDGIRRSDLVDGLFDGLFFGACGLIVILSLVNLTSTGEPLFRAHAVAVASAAAFVLFIDGYATAFSSWSTPGLTDFLVALTGAGMVVGTTKFSVRFLELDRHGPRIARALRRTVWCGLALAPLGLHEPFGDPLILGLFALRVTTGLVLLVASVRLAARRRTRGAVVVSVSYLAFSAFETGPLWVVGGVLPAASWSLDLLMVGIGLQMLTAHVTLAHRYRTLRHAATRAERAAAVAGIEARADRLESSDLRNRLERFRDALRAPRGILDRTSLRSGAEAAAGAGDPGHDRLREASRRLDQLAASTLVPSGAFLVQPDVRPTPLSDVVDDVLATWGRSVADLGGGRHGQLPLPVGGGPDGRLEILLPDWEPELLVDADLVQVAFTSLLEHARQRAVPGGDVRMSVSIPEGAGEVRLKACFEGAGRGLTGWELARLFETTSLADGRDGSALFVVRRIAELHGGDVEATILPDGRLRCCMTLPIAARPR
ncbi:MAG: hypothetical protein RL199_268 [Pseudomonadota bacterium]|jgi:signal transduction histidine kinase